MLFESFRGKLSSDILNERSEGNYWVPSNVYKIIIGYK